MSHRRSVYKGVGHRSSIEGSALLPSPGSNDMPPLEVLERKQPWSCAPCYFKLRCSHTDPQC